MLTKQAVNSLKQGNLPILYRILHESKDTRELLFLLENLGHLPQGFDGSALLPLIEHSSTQIQYWAVKNLAKLEDFQHSECLFQIATGDYDSMVRREAASALGRMRDERTIPRLIDLLADPDPKVVLQAIRGLLVFKDRSNVASVLKTLKSHSNETIQSVIAKAFFSTRPSSNGTRFHSPEHIRNLVVLGDVRETLALIPADSLPLTFTSPPYYNARDYSIYASYQAYLEFLSDVFRAVHRVTMEGRFFILNTSPVIIPRVSRAHASKRYPIPFDIHPRLVEMGWEFIDDILWVKPEASVKNRNGGFMQHRKPLAYKPNPVTEYLMVYRKQTDKLIDWNIRQYDETAIEESKVRGDYETTNVWRIDPTFDRVHSAVFPFELCRRVISFYSYVGDVVFDPFAGSGTLGRAAQALNRHFFLTERDEVYFERIKETLGSDLFSKTRFMTVQQLQESLENCLSTI